MTFEFIENITRADVAIWAHGETLEELFSSAANGLMSTMIENYNSLTKKVIKEVSLENTEIDLLLFNFLDEI